MYIVSVDNFSQWQQQARELLMREVAPEKISWQYDTQNTLPFDDKEDFMSLTIEHKSILIPKAFIPFAKKVACYRCHSRWALLYKLAWRTLFEDRYILKMEIDSEVSRALKMFKAVARDKHKMEAFVRFRRVDTTQATSQYIQKDAEEYYVAWFEPEH